MKIINVGDRVTNTWIYEIPDGYVMIDTGYPGKLKNAEKRMTRHGIQWSDIRCLFLTHAHDDHAGFLKDLMIKCPHIQVIANPDSLPVLRKGQNSFSGGCSTLEAFLFCKCMYLWGKGKHLFPPLSESLSDRILWISEENRMVLEKQLGGKILFTPGHTGDSVSLKVGQVVFAGDAAMNGFPSSHRITIWVEDPVAFGRSWDLLIAEEADMLYPGHGKPFAKEELVRFRPSVDRIKLYPLE